MGSPGAHAGAEGRRAEALMTTALAGLPKREGKVRDVYDLGDRLLMIATDRISAFDWVLPTGIPQKGRVLTALSAFWFSRLGGRNHLISTDVDQARLDLPAATRAELTGRTMLVKKAEVVPFECVVRGYLAGSGWKEYRTQGTVCGISLPAGLAESQKLDRPIFTPATKATSGHDENIPFGRMVETLGQELAEMLSSASIQLYQAASEYAERKGLILADTKFEWGVDARSGELLLVDEVLTPDSSRYWPKDAYKEGGPQPSFDKQFVRDWLEHSGWDKASPPPALPDEVVEKTQEKYIQAYELLTERRFLWN